MREVGGSNPPSSRKFSSPKRSIFREAYRIDRSRKHCCISGSFSTALLAEEPNKFCETRGPGIYGAGCSQYFIICDGNQALVRRCNGLLYFDEATLSCVSKSKCEACTRTSSPCTAQDLVTQAPVAYFTPGQNLYDSLPVYVSSIDESLLTTTAAPSRVVPQSFTCAGRVDGVYKQDCSGLFIVCNRGEATFLMCPSGLIFDGTTGRCQREVTGCDTQTQQAAELTRPVSAFSCRNSETDYYSQLSDNNVVKCSRGKSILLRCPRGFVLSTRDDLCTEFSLNRAKRYASYGLSALPNSALVESTEYAYGGYAATTGPSPFAYYPSNLLEIVKDDCVWKCEHGYLTVLVSVSDCNGLAYGVHGTGCSGEYVVALPDYCSVFMCPVGLVFDTVVEQCAPAILVPACKKPTVSPTGTPTVRTRTTVAPTRSTTPCPKTTFDCKNRRDGIYGMGCSKTFAVCVAGDVKLMLCPETLKFDAVSVRCLSEEYVPACGGMSTPIPRIPSVVAHPKKVSVAEHAVAVASCSGKADGVYNLGCLSEFYVCNNKVPVVMECPNRLIYDSFSGGCMAKDTVAECGGVSSSVTIPKRKDCTDYLGVISTGCNSYSVCLGATEQSFLCPAGYVFDASRHLCVIQVKNELSSGNFYAMCNFIARLLKLVLFAVLVHSSQECASNIGGTCYSVAEVCVPIILKHQCHAGIILISNQNHIWHLAGISYADMQSNVGFETCAEDLLKDWCVAKYEQDPINGGRFNYSCASSYHSSLLSLQCGDTISNINNRGCYKVTTTSLSIESSYLDATRLS
uniref:Chitin-binding type-2 domain-containing protein n=1 Tax=Syphacia muris TaxID=451379 RepID=A0A0N5AJZ8_9BILA